MSTIRLEYEHGTDICVLRACSNPDASDLLAIGGEHSVEVVQVGKSSCQQVATFHIGARVTALAWSPRATSPTYTEDWFVELVAAGDDLNLRLLTKAVDDTSGSIFIFGGGLSGHRRKVNDLTFCGGFGADSFRYLASVGDDKILLFWDLLPPPEPTVNGASLPLSPSPASPSSPPRSLTPSSRPMPLAFGVPYAHPLHSVASHPSTSKELVVSDAQGSVFVVNWRVTPDDDDPEERMRGLSVAQLVEPRALADARTGMHTVWSGSTGWQEQDVNIIGATYGARWAVWDLRKLQGGKPLISGPGFTQGSQRFRWCPTDSQLFALSTNSPIEDAAIRVHNIVYAQSTPRHLVLRPRPHRIRDFDWLAITHVPGIPCLAAAVGRSVLIVDVIPEN